MSAHSIWTLYLLFFTLHVCTECWLDRLNIHFVRKNSAEVPSRFRNHFDLETYNRAISYTITKGRFSILSTLYSSMLVLLILTSGLLVKLDMFARTWSWGPYTHGIFFVLLVTLLFSLLGLPLGIYSTFVIEQRYGFNRITPKLWVIDLIKSAVLSAILLSVLLLGLFWFMEVSASAWWLYAFFFVIGFQLLLLFLYPAFIAPIFNKFWPLEEGELAQAVNELAQKLGYKISGIFKMDGSKRSSHANAYFTGFGAKKRIVLYDTLIEKLGLREVLAVLAHEIGHEKLRHVWKSFLYSGVIALLSFWILAHLLNYEPFFLAFGFPKPSWHVALVLFMFASGPLMFFLSPVFSIMSRKHEYEADEFATDAMDEASSLIEALLKLSKTSLSNLTPHPWYSFFHYSHPTLTERIVAMEQYEVTKNKKSN